MSILSFPTRFSSHSHPASKARAGRQCESKLPEPVVCPQCRAVYRAGQWRWLDVPKWAYREICPSCHRCNHNHPAGYVILEGAFFHAHLDEIMRLVHNHEQYERVESPLKRIIAIEMRDASLLVTTTDIHLARDLGEAVQRAYQGRLEFCYNSQEKLLHVRWRH